MSWYDLRMRVSWPIFQHDCSGCEYLGSEDIAFTGWNRRGVSLVRRRDFYVCQIGWWPVFKVRFGHAPGDCLAVPGEHLERWDLLGWTAKAASGEDDPSVPLKALQMLYRDSALERGFAVYQHPRNVTSAYVLASPVLGPAEHQLIGESMRQVLTTMQQERSGERLAGSDLRRIADALVDKLKDQANRKGSVTRWNRWGRDVVEDVEASSGDLSHGPCDSNRFGASGVDHGSRGAS